MGRQHLYSIADRHCSASQAVIHAVRELLLRSHHLPTPPGNSNPKTYGSVNRCGRLDKPRLVPTISALTEPCWRPRSSQPCPLQPCCSLCGAHPASPTPASRAHLPMCLLALCPAVKSNDMMLAIYLSALIRSVLALHKLIDNKEQRLWREKEAAAEKDKKAAAAAAKTKEGDKEKEGGQKDSKEVPGTK